MSASISNFSDARERREIRRLEEAVKAQGLARIGSREVVRNDYFFPRSREEQKFRDVPLQKTEPLKSWGSDILAGVFLAIFILCVVVVL